MTYEHLFAHATLGSLHLKNKFVMSPMTRSRATGNLPNALMATYYGQRAGAGLIISEGTSPSPNGLGYARIPGAFNQEQANGWHHITEAVHQKGGRIFLQLMHTGRVSHIDNLPQGAEIVAPSAVPLEGEMYTDTKGMQPYPTPREMTAHDVKHAVHEFATAAKYGIDAGFDGVELHGANGYLIEQFLSPVTNHRVDTHGGSTENRARFALEVAKAVADAIGPERTGIRLSPYGVFSGMAEYDDLEATYEYLALQLHHLGLLYIHLVNHSSMGAPEVKPSVVEKIRAAFKGPLILSGGYDADRAEADLKSGAASLVAFGRPFLANPDFPERIKHGSPLNAPDMNTFYTPGEKGYTDYPALTKETV